MVSCLIRLTGSFPLGYGVCFDALAPRCAGLKAVVLPLVMPVCTSKASSLMAFHLPMPRLPALFLHHADIRHHHAAINGFAHVVNGE